MDRIRTIEQAIEEIRVHDPESALSEWALRQLINNGELPCLSVGKKRLISMETLEEFLHRNTS